MTNACIRWLKLYKFNNNARNGQCKVHKVSYLLLASAWGSTVNFKISLFSSKHFLRRNSEKQRIQPSIPNLKF